MLHTKATLKQTLNPTNSSEQTLAKLIFFEKKENYNLRHRVYRHSEPKRTSLKFAWNYFVCCRDHEINDN